MASTNYYLYLDGIRGGSKATRHAGDIDISSYSLGNYMMRQDAGGGGVPGTIHISELYLVKGMDVASVRLMDFYRAGKKFAKAKLMVETILPGGKIKPFITLEMENVSISNFLAYGAAEQLTLNFSKFNYIH